MKKKDKYLLTSITYIFHCFVFGFVFLKTLPEQKPMNKICQVESLATTRILPVYSTDLK